MGSLGLLSRTHLGNLLLLIDHGNGVPPSHRLDVLVLGYRVSQADLRSDGQFLRSTKLSPAFSAGGKLQGSQQSHSVITYTSCKLLISIPVDEVGLSMSTSGLTNERRARPSPLGAGGPTCGTVQQYSPLSVLYRIVPGAVGAPLLIRASSCGRAGGW